jgi:hypothetical protein
MGTRIGLLLGLMLVSWSAPGLTPAAPPDTSSIPDAPTAVPGTLVPADALGVRFLAHQGQWTSFLSMNGGAEPILLITGRLENTSGKPFTYVKLQFELLGGDDVVFRDHGYNRKAEALREEAYETGQKPFTEMDVEQLGVGAQDEFRFIFFKADVPEFRFYRIRVLETR